ncbi:patatin-like phospholipase family protein [Vibrio sp. SS-MA-C1-2]|uniref:patatin-like phospholipase family protein n=1 Tax=Vibrio sp. SS-MA-C1-2 TaxID=2908646 RepID=UPI001F1CEA6B|nr:patatin-like phospholipase family protein [Vibrio sp. SS-MA-C1-2]UJF17882.1 patatin-like phospholipase family protein [Vibrio sp. SS-MA-C1-2]
MARFRLLAITMGVLGLASCSNINKYDQLSAENIQIQKKPQQKPQLKDDKKPQLAIAFGGGSSRGMMHLGVIKALDEAGIKADIVTGTSVGSIAAVLYATHDYPEIEKIMFGFSEHEITDFRLSTKGLIKGKALAKWINKSTGEQDISQLPIKTAIVSTNLSTQKAVMFTAGNIGQAVQTSSSVPGIFMPVYHNEDILVDGGVLSLVPVYAARQLGADFVIGVDVFCSQPPPLKYTAFDVSSNTFWLQSCISTKEEVESADILVVPTPSNPGLAEFGGYEERKAAMDAGYKAMKAVIEKNSELQKFIRH